MEKKETDATKKCRTLISALIKLMEVGSQIYDKLGNNPHKLIFSSSMLPDEVEMRFWKGGSESELFVHVKIGEDVYYDGPAIKDKNPFGWDWDLEERHKPRFVIKETLAKYIQQRIKFLDRQPTSIEDIEDLDTLKELSIGLPPLL